MEDVTQWTKIKYFFLSCTEKNYYNTLNSVILIIFCYWHTIIIMKENALASKTNNIFKMYKYHVLIFYQNDEQVDLAEFQLK